MIAATLGGGVSHGASTLSPVERQAALNALSKIKSLSGRLGSALGNVTKSATLLGGAAHKPEFSATTLVQGSGHDTFIGGARTAPAAHVGSDTVVSGSTRSFERGLSPAHTAQMAGQGLGIDTINIAGATA